MARRHRMRHADYDGLSAVGQGRYMERQVQAAQGLAQSRPTVIGTAIDCSGYSHAGALGKWSRGHKPAWPQ
jgi:hypothetical protein